MNNNKKVFFPNLDALRTIAFLLVFLQHGFLNAMFALHLNGVVYNKLISMFFLTGWFGVQIFFVLSGFLITYLMQDEINISGKLNVGYFYLRRTLRIWPLYFAVVIFAFILYPFLKLQLGIHSDLCSQPWYYFVFLGNFDVIHVANACAGKAAMTQTIVWSVGIEEQFYLVWPLLFVLFTSKKTIWIPIGVLLISLLFSICHAADPGPILYFHTLAVCGDLAIGGLLALLMLRRGRIYNFIRTLKQRHIAIAYIFIALFYTFSYKLTFPYSPVVYRYIFDFFWGFIIIEQCFSEHSIWQLGKIKALNYWGKYTYGLYLLHPVGILVVDIALRLAHVDNTLSSVSFLGAFIALAISMGLAYISYNYFEYPFLKLKNKFVIIPNKRTE